MGLVHSRVGWVWLAAMLVASPVLAEESPAAAASNTEATPGSAEFPPAEAGSDAVGSISVAVQGKTSDPIQVTADGAEVPRDRVGVPFAVTAGEHVFQARSGDLTSSSVRVLIPAGGTATVILTLISPDATAQPAQEISSPVFEGPAVPAAAPPSPVRDRSLGGRPFLIGAITALSVGVVSLGVGSYFAFSDAHSAEAERLWNECQPMCSLAEAGPIRTEDAKAEARRQALTVTGFVGGGLGLATAGVLFVLDRTHQPSQHARRVTPLVGANYVGLLGSF